MLRRLRKWMESALGKDITPFNTHSGWVSVFPVWTDTVKGEGGEGGLLNQLINQPINTVRTCDLQWSVPISKESRSSKFSLASHVCCLRPAFWTLLTFQLKMNQGISQRCDGVIWHIFLDYCYLWPGPLGWNDGYHAVQIRVAGKSTKKRCRSIS